MKTLSIAIETAKDRDYQQIFSIWLHYINDIYPGDYFDQRRLASRFRENYKNRNDIYPFYAARDEDDEIIGWMGIIPSCHNPLRESICGEISIYVRNDVRHEGIGSSLLQHATEKAAQTDLLYLEGYTRVTNYPIRKLLLKYGWEETGLFPQSARTPDYLQRIILMYPL